MENKISIEINPEAIANSKACIGSIELNLPKLSNLSDEERKAIPKMGDKTVAFVNKALEHAKHNTSVVPSFLDMAEFEKDVKAVNDLNQVLKPLKQLVEKLDDTTMLAGSEAYTAALTFYSALKGAAKAGVPGMKTVFDDLQARFPGRSKSKNTGIEPEKN